MRSDKLFQIFRQGENEVLIASKARWSEQLKGLVELERRCLTFSEEVEYSSERQEVLSDLAVSKQDMQRTAPEDCQRQIFEELKELEERRAKESLALLQKKQADQVGRRKGKGQGPCKGWRRQEQLVHGLDASTILLLVRAHLPWSFTQMKECRLPLTWRKMQMMQRPYRLGLHGPSLEALLSKRFAAYAQ